MLWVGLWVGVWCSITDGGGVLDGAGIRDVNVDSYAGGEGLGASTVDGNVLSTAFPRGMKRSQNIGLVACRYRKGTQL